MKLPYKTKIVTSAFAIGLLLFFSSCLKNNKYYIDLTKGAANIELPLAAVYANQPFALALKTVDTPSTYYVYVNVASPHKLGTAVTATLGLDSAFLNTYNADSLAADTNYIPFTVLPDSCYTISSWTLTVPANQRQAYATIKIYTSKISGSGNYVLPFTITSSSIALSNWNHLLIHISAQSPWAGNYLVNTVISGANNYDGTYPGNAETLATVAGNVVSEPDIAAFFGGYTTYTFNADGTISVGAYGSQGGGSYGATVISSSYNATTNNFNVVFSILRGKYVFTETYVHQ